MDGWTVGQMDGWMDGWMIDWMIGSGSRVDTDCTISF